MLQMFVLALSLYNTWNRGVFLLCKITNLLIYSTIKACGKIRFLHRRIRRFYHKKYCQKAILFLTVFLSFFNLSIILIQFQSYVSLSLKASESLSLKVLYTFQLLFLMLFHRKLLSGSSTDQILSFLYYRI